MRLTIDNYDGAGPVEYSQLLSNTAPLTIERRLNAPTLCEFRLVRPNATFRMPVRDAYVTVQSDAGSTLFTGYVSSEPSLRYLGLANEGPLMKMLVHAESDEFLLDRLGYAPPLRTIGDTVPALIQAMTDGLGGGGLHIASTTDVAIAAFQSTPGGCWSQNVGHALAMGCSTYRVMNGGVSLVPIANARQVLDERQGTLELDGLEISAVKGAANDVTLCGEIEPGTYVTEIFEGDGETSSFELGESLFMPSSTQKATLVSDDFRGAEIDRGNWRIQDPSGQIALRAESLIATGGTGVDGQTALESLVQLELGGALVAELTGVQVTSGEGLLCGFFAGGTTAGCCLSGFLTQSSSTSVQLSAVVAGGAAGSTLVLVPGHVCSLRVRLHTVEIQRMHAAYFSRTEAGTKRYGGDLVRCGAQLLLEVQDTTGGVVGPITVLYEGSIEECPAIGRFVPLSSVSLQASVRTASVTETGSAWITSRFANGAARTRRIGPSGDGADCALSASGIVRFYAGREPAAEELVSVSYRARKRAVARGARSATDEPDQGSTTTSQWMGAVRSPAARSSVDCENAVAAVLDFSCRSSGALKGSYVTFSSLTPEGVWPGDALQIRSPSLQMDAVEVIVRAVLIESESSAPDEWKYRIEFANDWADDLAIRLDQHIPSDLSVPRNAGIEVLDSVSELKAELLPIGVVEIDARMNPPTGGGFEVRRRDGVFGPGVDSDLVLRSPVRVFQIPRSAAEERFYVRMYDGATPPRYSRFAAAILVHAHL